MWLLSFSCHHGVIGHHGVNLFTQGMTRTFIESLHIWFSEHIMYFRFILNIYIYDKRNEDDIYRSSPDFKLCFLYYFDFQLVTFLWNLQCNKNAAKQINKKSNKNLIEKLNLYYLKHKLVVSSSVLHLNTETKSLKAHKLFLSTKLTMPWGVSIIKRRAISLGWKLCLENT